MKLYELLVFDWDGTLADSHRQIIECMQATAKALEAKPPSDEATQGIIGLSLDRAVRALYPHQSDAFVRRFAQVYREHYLAEESPPLFEGVPTLLEELENKGYLLAIATGKGRAGLDQALSKTGLRERFHFTRCADESFSKPHPAMLEELMEMSGVMPSQTLMIGDAGFDLEMAHYAGVDAVGVAQGGHKTMILNRWNPKTVLEKITDLPEWLDNSRAGGSA